MQSEILKISGIKVINNIPHAVGADSVQKVFEFYGIKKSKKSVYKFISKALWRKRVKIEGRSMIAIPIPQIEAWIKKNYPIIWDSKKDEEKELIIKNFKMIDNFEKIIDEMGEKLSNIEMKEDKNMNESDNEHNENENQNEEEKEKEIISRIWSKQIDIAEKGEEEKNQTKKEQETEMSKKQEQRKEKEQERDKENDKEQEQERGSKPKKEIAQKNGIQRETTADEMIREQIDAIVSTILKNPPSDFKEETLKYAREKFTFILGFIDNISNLRK